MKLDLAELQKRFQVRAALAITVESGRTVVDHVRRDENTSRVLHSFTLPWGAEAVRCVRACRPRWARAPRSLRWRTR